MLLKKMLIVIRRASTEASLSRELVPSQSRKYMSTGTKSPPTLISRSIGEDQIQIPLVQALVVPPTSNPFIRWSIWFARKDFPDRYGPQSVTGAT